MICSVNKNKRKGEKLSNAERQKQFRATKKAEKQLQLQHQASTRNALANTHQQCVNRPEFEAAEDDDDYVFQFERIPFVPQDTTSIDAKFKKWFYDNKFGLAYSVCDRL
jgi:hypothetical protein